MKVGIITYHNVINYGALLQALALQQAVMDNGAVVSIINYTPKDVFSTYKILSSMRIKRCWNISPFLALKSIASDLKNIVYLTRKNKAFLDFGKKYFNYSGCEFFDIKNPKGNTLDFDVCFAGSDQIWNPDITYGFDDAYFLEFGSQKMIRASYAASIGRDSFSDEEKKQLKQLLSVFDYISVREKSAKTVLDGVTDKNIETVLDPTLLLNAEKWRNILSVKDGDKKYIFVYTLYQNKELDQYVEELSKRTGLPVVTITRRKLYSNQNEVFPCADPKQFVELVSGAEYVVTNSFHGTAFSVNFSKKFVTFKGEKRNSRITDLLATLGIPERAVSSYNEELFKLPEIDYKTVHRNLEAKRKESFAYINKVLESFKKHD